MKLPIISRRQKIIGISVFILLLLLLIIDKSRVRNADEFHTTDSFREEKRKRFSDYESPIDLLNKEIVNENPDLQKLEEEIRNCKIEHHTLTKRLNVYKKKFDNLYNSTQFKAKDIIDSTLQKSMSAHIQLQADKFSEKINELDYLIKQMEKKNKLLNDKHVELKIELILNKIKMLRQKELPGKKEYVDQLINQEKLISRTINLFPKK